MAWLNSQFTIEEAIARDFDTWELLITDWGQRTTPADEYSWSFPKIGQKGLPSVQGIAIGPRSTVDRCFVSYSIQKVVSGGINYDYTRRLVLGSPLMFAQVGAQEIVQPNPAPLFAPTPAQGAASLVIYPQSGTDTGGNQDTTMYGTTYNRTGAGAPGGGIGVFGDGGIADGVDWQSPTLHLIFFLKPQAVNAPAKRGPYVLGGTHTLQPADTTYHLVAQVPTFGRKTIKIVVNQLSDATEAIAVRVGAIQSMITSGVGGLTEGLLLEQTSAATGFQSYLGTIQNVQADYLNLYLRGSTSTGLPFAGRYQIIAYDD